MSHELKEGVELKSVFWSEDEIVAVGQCECRSIVIREQLGQMSMVPWAEATFEDGTKSLYNLAKVEGVTVLQQHDLRVNE